MNTIVIKPRHKRIGATLRGSFVLGALLLAGGVAMAAGPDLAPKSVNIGEDFLKEFKILTYILMVIAFLVGNILLLLLVKDPSKLSLKYILGHFVGKDSVDTEMHHEYDGIRELDNPMPAWLATIFYGSILFAGVYLLHYHVLGTGPSSKEEYEHEMAVAAEMYKDVELTESQVVLLTDAGRLKAGSTIFMENCATCHGEKLEGLTGPNLVDPYWLHGGDVKDVYKVISEGVPGKTMIAWKGRISSNDRLNLASYILSLQGSNPPNAKAPEGNMAGEGGAPAPVAADSASVDSAAADSGTSK